MKKERERRLVLLLMNTVRTHTKRDCWQNETINDTVGQIRTLGTDIYLDRDKTF